MKMQLHCTQTTPQYYDQLTRFHLEPSAFSVANMEHSEGKKGATMYFQYEQQTFNVWLGLSVI